MTLDWFSRLQGSWKKCVISAVNVSWLNSGFSCRSFFPSPTTHCMPSVSETVNLSPQMFASFTAFDTDGCFTALADYTFSPHTWSPAPSCSVAPAWRAGLEPWPSLAGAAGCLRQFALWSALPATSTGFNSAVLWEFPSSTSVLSEHWWRGDHGSLMNSL